MSYLTLAKCRLHLRVIIKKGNLSLTKLRLSPLKLIIVPFIDLLFFETKGIGKLLYYWPLPKIGMSQVVV